MTILEALKMVRNAEIHADAFGTNLREIAKAQKDTDLTLQRAISSLEFESFFEQGGTVRRVA